MRGTGDIGSRCALFNVGQCGIFDSDMFNEGEEVRKPARATEVRQRMDCHSREERPQAASRGGGNGRGG